MTETEAYIAFSVFPGIGPVRFSLLRSYFGTALDAWNASEQDLQSIHLSSALLRSFLVFRSEFDIRAYTDRMRSLGIVPIPISDSRYPTLLGQIPDPPFVLYVRSGRHDKPIALDRTVAVVGTRKPSTYGMEVTARICRELAMADVTIVSGMAIGVDAIAHEAAIGLKTPTIAVLGCGVDIPAPLANSHIYRELARGEGGAVVSEMPVSLRPDKRLFPVRNRIISGLSRGILVTEGTDTSGALITASYAARQGREVFAVPGAITNPNSRAPFRLIRDGATPIESGSDIVRALGLDRHPKERDTQSVQADDRLTSEAERRIMACLSGEILHADDLVQRTELPAPTVFSALTVLELKGIIRDTGGKVYVRT